jgi:hypothetical protein
VAVSEESSTGTPRRRWGSWLRRTSLRVRIAAGVVAAAVIAAVASVAVPSSSSPSSPTYSGLPPACALISEATLAKYLPDPSGTAESMIPAAGYKVSICKWSSTAGGADRTLEAQVFVFRSSSPVSLAQRDYASTLAVLDCHCQGLTVSTKAVTDLGDQAAALFLAGRPDPDVVTSPQASFPGAYLIVRSGNAEIRLIGSVTATGPASVTPPGPAQLTGMISVARGILAALARHAVVSSHPPTSREPHYAGQPDPCLLITMASLARYAPGTVVDPMSVAVSAPGSPNTSECAWNSGPVSVTLTLSIFPGAATARQHYSSDAQGDRQYGTGTGEPVTGSQWLPGLGEEATAIFQGQADGSGVELVVWSGNAEIQVSYTFSTSPGRTALVAGAAAMARDSLAALANPAAISAAQGPAYTSPRHPCALIKAPTLATYVPGATILTNNPGSDAYSPQESECTWGGPTATVDLTVSTYASAESAQSGSESDVKGAEQSGDGITVTGTQPVKGLGGQADAIFETGIGGPATDLFVWSGTAEIEVDLIESPSFSHAALLAAATAMAREVLADLPR